MDGGRFLFEKLGELGWVDRDKVKATDLGVPYFNISINALQPLGFRKEWRCTLLDLEKKVMCVGDLWGKECYLLTTLEPGKYEGNNGNFPCYTYSSTAKAILVLRNYIMSNLLEFQFELDGTDPVFFRISV